METRVLLAADLGDAPDTGTGTGTGNYETLLANGGPSHVIDTTQTTLFLGDSVDGDAGTLQNARANADDVNGALPDDEDGVLSPFTDLVGTVGATPTITLLVTNTSGSAATLAGWIDYNKNGVFDNSTERATVTVATGTTDGRVTLTFPAIPSGSAGQTYARFRLSTDVAAANPTGAASDGEVEDYVFTITSRANQPVTIDSFLKIASGTNGGPTLADDDLFGKSVTSLGDLDGDGVADLAVGARGDDTDRGAVHVLLMNSDGTVKSSVKIASGTSGGPAFADGDSFGSSVTSLGDLDGDGVADLAVGARSDDTGGNARGAVHVLFLNSDGTVKSSRKITTTTASSGPTLADGDFFGSSVSSLGDLDGDGVADLAVGARLDDTGGADRGAVYLLMLNPSGTVKSSVKIASGTSGGPTLADGDFFGVSVASLGDLDGDGVVDLAIGATGDDMGGSYRGAVHVLLLNSSGTVKSSVKIASATNGGPTLADVDLFGTAVTSLGDLDGDGVADLGVGARFDDSGGTDRGAVHLLLLNSSGTVKSRVKIASGTNGGPTLANFDDFGSSVTSLGDLDGDGVADLAIGAYSDDTGGSARGAVHVLFLKPLLDFGDAPSPYPTTIAEDGARHGDTGLTLGASRDSEGDGTHSAVADADGADEDGVTFGTIRVGALNAVATVNVQGGAGLLDAWIDFNGDGNWGAAGEQIAHSVPVSTGDTAITFDVPSWAVAGNTFARFRLSSAGGLGVGGAAADGEVEDYLVTITPPNATALIGTRQIISNSADGVVSIDAVDLDDDGDLDIVGGTFLSNTVSWFENDGNQSFSEHVVATGRGTQAVFGVDFDGDGDRDIVSISPTQGSIFWYENDGSESFTERTVSTGLGGVATLVVADINSDGDLDAIGSRSAGGVSDFSLRQ